jgi:flagellar biogenesis protein FliO
MIRLLAQLSPELAENLLETPLNPALDPASPTSYGSAIVQMLLTFTVVIALLFVSFWFLRRLIQNRLQKGTGNQAIQILEKRMISPKTMLYWIEVDNKKILIAESQIEVRKLESYPISEEPQE